MTAADEIIDRAGGDVDKLSELPGVELLGGGMGHRQPVIWE